MSDKASLKAKLAQRPSAAVDGEAAGNAAGEGSAGNELRKKLEARRMQSSKGGGKLQCYAKLEGPHVRHLIRTVAVTLGRQRDSSHHPTAAEDAAPEQNSSKSFVSLGQDKAVSNTHLQIFWDFRKKEWVLVCLGRNGAMVDGQRVNKGDMAVSIKNKSRVQVPSGHHFVFLCPAGKSAGSKKPKGSKPAASGSPATGVEAEKPEQTFAELIAEAILSAADHKMAVGEIYQHIKTSHAYYRQVAEGTWQSSIRHSLTSNKSFLKTTREHSATLPAPPSLAAANAQKGVCWTIRPEVLAELLAGGGRAALNSKAHRDKLLATPSAPSKPLKPHPSTSPAPRPEPSPEPEVGGGEAEAEQARQAEAEAEGEEGDADADDSDEGDGGMVIDD